MFLVSSALRFYVDWDFFLRHMSMDLSSGVAALSSHGVPSVTKTTIQVASPQGFTADLASPELSGPFNHPGQYLDGSRGYPNVVPAGAAPPLGSQGMQVEPVGTLQATFPLPLCCPTEAF